MNEGGDMSLPPCRPALSDDDVHLFGSYRIGEPQRG